MEGAGGEYGGEVRGVISGDAAGWALEACNGMGAGASRAAAALEAEAAKLQPSEAKRTRR